MLRLIIILVLSLGLAAAGWERMRVQPPLSQGQEALYLPNGRGLKAISFGYEQVLSHVLWFNTISYFGKHYRSDRDYRYLKHMCSLVTSLSPKAQHVYEFCGMMLAWEGGLPVEGEAMFTAGMREFPDDWRFPYWRGFVRIFFLANDQGGHDDFVASSKLPDAHPLVARLASKQMLNAGTPESAIAFLQEALQGARDEQTRKVLTERLLEVYYESEARQIEDAFQRYVAEHGTPPEALEELVNVGLLHPRFAERDFRDPFGGHYVVDPVRGVVGSTSGKKRDRLHWKRFDDGSNSESGSGH